jgi:CDP-diacylglycerol---glycerol-3-phosphate 3-phosphatidyltransferase
MNLPIAFTLLRICLIPAVVMFFYLPFDHAHLIASLIFVFAAITDWIDGFLARSLNQVSKFGAFLDPVADKLMVATVLVIIVGSLGGIVLAIPAVIIVGREIVISALREWMAEIGKRTSVAVGRIGKVKTAVQMLALIALLYYSPGLNEGWRHLGIVLLYIAALLTLWSMLMYLKVAWRDLTLARNKE